MAALDAPSTPNLLPGGARFDAFEVDLLSGELRRDGRRVRLQDQPCRILRILLEGPGEIVTREQLRESAR